VLQAGSSGNGVRPVVAETFTECMEQLQEGYVASVAATAGCLLEPVARDRYGMDVMFVRVRPAGLEEVSVYAQLKNTTTVKPDPAKQFFSYQFKKKEYLERLAAPRSGIKAILVVMATHPHQELWTNGDHDSLALLHCCYWMSLEGETVPPGVNAPTVRVPTSNIFNADTLTCILDRIERGEALR